MRSRYHAALMTAAGTCVGLLGAPTAAAAPECTQTGPTTSVCTTNGSSQITTSPPARNFGPGYGGFPYGGFPYGGFPIGGLVISLG